MNIYIHLEVSSRELDSKLLLAVLAASRGHHVLVSDQESIHKGLRRKTLAPGVFHTKSVTPAESKITKHNLIIETGSKITSLDEEGGLVDYGYEKFAKLRYNDQSINQCSAIFAWGTDDAQTLKKLYPHHSEKIHMTGSPRADLWQPFFSRYWDKDYEEFNKPYLLISSNMGVLNNQPFHEYYKFLNEKGYFKRDPEYLNNFFERIGEEYLMVFHFFKAIRFLAINNNSYDIILRPHPRENVKIWQSLLEDVPNVKIIRKDSMSTWINKSFAVMHNSCTTALEASLSRKPIITFVPFKANYSRELPNDLGYRVETLEDLSKKIDKIIHEGKFNNDDIISKPIPKIVSDKIYIDEKEHAAMKIIKIWENLDNEHLSRPNNWPRFMLKLKIMKLNGFLGRFYRKIIKKEHIRKENYKFPQFDKNEIYQKVNKLQKMLEIKNQLYCKVLSDRTILIKLR